MILFLRYVTLGEDEATLIATDDGGTEKQYFRYDFTMAAKVRDRSQTLYASGDCASAEAIGYGVDCDGGGIDIEPVAGKDDTILVRLERSRMTLGCNEGPEIDLEGGADNRLFKLTKAPRPFATPCKPKPRSDSNDSGLSLCPGRHVIPPPCGEVGAREHPSSEAVAHLRSARRVGGCAVPSTPPGSPQCGEPPSLSRGGMEQAAPLGLTA